MRDPAPHSHPCSRGQRLLSGALLALLVLGPAAAGMVAGYRLSERAGLAQLAALGNERLELYAATLEAELARFAYLPGLVASDPDVRALLADEATPAERERVDQSLARIGVRSGANLILVSSPDNPALASSNRYQSAPDAPLMPPVANSVAQVLHDGTADFFAANESDGSTDYYFAQPVLRQGKNLGQVIVRVNLAPLEATWIDLGLRSQSERLMVVDDNGVVVMSSVPAWKYRTLESPITAPLTTPRSATNVASITAPTPAPAASTGRYAAASLTPLALVTLSAVEPNVNLVRVPGAEDGSLATRFMAQERPIVPLGARLVALSDPSGVLRQARNAAWGGGAGGAVLGLLALYLLHRRRALRQLFQARNALQQAHDQLERQVDERTHQLRSANSELKDQITQRLQAEDELMQAGKLAVLGQMSAGISHEINQPLTALRALSRNAIRLLEGGRNADVANNLHLIDEMTERMGRIVNQLKSFARKDGLSEQPVALAGVVQNVLLMLAHRLKPEAGSPLVTVQLEVPEGLQARADANRLEQVLLNLAGNA
ncbi:sensor histidine kinase, partial [Ideonella sp.]|uniref:sensor histidine kinase n=1 Tax=Ideonella sp. TaxID=1929293 RepID=UPI003BB72BC3